MNDPSKEKKSRRTVGVLLLLLAFALFVVVVMFLNSGKPDHLGPLAFDSQLKGDAFIKTNQAIMEQMLEDWLPNDIFWPTVLLDNRPNFQIGQLEVIRYNIRILRDNLTRMRTTDKLDPLAEAAFTAISNDPYKWWFPSAESKWRQVQKSLKGFHDHLLAGRSHFYPRADNLAELLTQYASLMGGVNTRLINAPHDVDKVLPVEDETRKGSGISDLVDTAIPWYRIDDNFYYAQGVAYTLYESMKAIRTDFMDVLVDKNAVKMVDKILEDLERCHFEPLIVFNGGPASIFANHSLNLSSVFNDARQKIQSLIVALQQG
jgi:hypothetical protein